MPHDSQVRATTLKVESRTRIDVLRERVGAEHEGPAFRKEYRTPGRLAWRTIFLPSRAHREYLALQTAAAAGLPCVVPISWSEIRAFACVRTCAVTSKYIAGGSIKALLERGTLSSRKRRQLCIQIGQLLREFHDAGMLWMTAVPRNLISTPEGNHPLIACDLPYGLTFRKPITGSAKARIDLFSMGFSPSRKNEFSRGDRRAMLLAYCQAQRPDCRDLWQAMGVRTPFQQTLARTLMYCGPGLFYPALRRLAGRLLP